MLASPLPHHPHRGIELMDHIEGRLRRAAPGHPRNPCTGSAMYQCRERSRKPGTEASRRAFASLSYATCAALLLAAGRALSPRNKAPVNSRAGRVAGRLRRSTGLPAHTVTQEVLARWPVRGWLIRFMVVPGWRPGDLSAALRDRFPPKAVGAPARCEQRFRAAAQRRAFLDGRVLLARVAGGCRLAHAAGARIHHRRRAGAAGVHHNRCAAAIPPAQSELWQPVFAPGKLDAIPHESVGGLNTWC